MTIKNMSEILKAYNNSIDWLKAEGYELELSDYVRRGERGLVDRAKPCLLVAYNKGAYGQIEFEDEYTFFNSISIALNNFNYKEQRVFLWFLGNVDKIEVIAGE